MSHRWSGSCAAVAVVVALAGCGGGSPEGGPSPFASEPTSVPSISPSGPPGSPTATSRASAPAGGTTSRGASPSPDPALSGGPSALPVAAAYSPPAAGTYTYATTGSTTVSGCTSGTEPADPTATLEVGPVTGARQQAVRRSGERAGDETSVVEYRADGIYLVSLVFDQPGMGRIEFRPAEPVLLLPAAPAVGRRWSWSMTSTDGRYTVSQDSRVEALREDVRLGDGSAVRTTRVHSDVRLRSSAAGGGIDVTIRTTGWAVADPALEAKSVEDVDGTAGTCRISGHEESVLRSTSPG